MRNLAATVTICCCMATPSSAGARIVSECIADRLTAPKVTPVFDPGALQGGPEVRVLYFVPSDAAHDSVQYDRIVQASKDVHRWYADHTDNGRSYIWNGDVEWVNGQNTIAYYQVDNWGRVLSELSTRGYPIWGAGKVFAVWIKNGNQAGGASGSGWAGSAVIPADEFIAEGCVPSHPSNWPCVPPATMAHELGHALGLPHPDAAGGWNGDYLNDNSLMGSHWNFPVRDPRNYTADSPWGLLNYERDHLRYNPVLGVQGSPYPPIPNDPAQKPALPNPPLTLDVQPLGPASSGLHWNGNGANSYNAYWSQTPAFASYTQVEGSPTSGVSLSHTDSGQPILFFRVCEIALSP